MKIKKLWFNNFRTIAGHYDVPLDEDCTINLFAAKVNGAGKSSIIFGVYYMLTGYVSGKTTDEYVNWSAKDMSCGMEFEYKGHQFKIDCSYKLGTDKSPGKADKNLWIDTDEFNGVTGCNKKLKEFFDPNLFIGATGLFQNAKNFTSVKDSERRDNIKKVFNLDYKDECKDIEKEEKKVKDEELAPAEKQLLILKSKTFNEEKLLDFPISESIYVDNKTSIQKANEELIDLKARHQSIDETVTKKKNLENQLIRYSGNKNNTIDKLNKEIVNKKTYEQFSTDETTLSNLKDQLIAIKIERVKTFDEAELIEKQKELAHNKTVLYSLKSKFDNCRNGKCPVCEKPFSDHDTQAIVSEMESIETANETLTVKIQDLQNEKRDYENQVKANESKRRDKELLESKIQAEADKLKREQEVNSQKLNQCIDLIKSYEDTIQDFDNQITKANEELSLIGTIEDHSTLSNKIAEVEKTISSLQHTNQQYESIVAKNQLIQQNNEKLKQEEINTKIQIEDTQKIIDELVLKKQQLSKMRFFLEKEFPSYVISTMIQQIQDDMNEFISKVYYKDLDVEINGDDDNIEVLYGTGDRKIDAINASGAEESLLSLSYCYALNKLKGYNILFIDEVDSSLTEKAALDLAEMMEKIKSEYDFIMIISHVKAVQDYLAVNGANIVEVDRSA